MLLVMHGVVLDHGDGDPAHPVINWAAPVRHRRQPPERTLTGINIGRTSIIAFTVMGFVYFLTGAAMTLARLNAHRRSSARLARSGVAAAANRRHLAGG
ncbi:MAG: hypothetical protein U0869_03920 [Chloroflexota bacterium]